MRVAVAPLIPLLAFGCGVGGTGHVPSTTTDGGPTETGTPPGTETGTTTDPTGVTVGTPDCGTCPTGTTCGSANGIPVCRDDDSGLPRFEHVFVFVMENTSLSTLMSSSNTPYLRSLVRDWAYGADYHGVEHPSLPNYLELVSGKIKDNGPLDCDCDPTGAPCSLLTCNLVLSSCGCPQSHRQLVDELEDAGVGWRAYAESMGAPCTLTASGDYAPKHVPFLYFPELTDDRPRCTDHVVDYAQFPDDLAAGPRAFTFVAPNLVHDMHDPFPAGAENLANGDQWLAKQLPHVLASPAFTDRGLVVVVWDEDDLSGELHPDDPIPLIVLSPLAKQGGYASQVRADHDSLLATFEDGLGVDRLGQSAGADPLVDFFPAR